MSNDVKRKRQEREEKMVKCRRLLYSALLAKWRVVKSSETRLRESHDVTVCGL